ncbi:hypothetical protein JIG36_04465 [Actinoplanes sp. LDG1-06]|uniref:Uncharacterized protein n=1 Tax=Paractinoplanes ovalisporus TaxID=2810368 RepID=A0ABS2A6A4_9ACTN|nr:hypothetical protein [Actinoplanes ovalisporus]MBM2614809.1 hypothetical protein [Actinoplanes ovalisporus]
MSEDDRAVRILRTLPDEPPAPSTVDLARTITDGKRRRRTRQWSGGVAVAAVTAVAATGGALALRETPSPPPLIPPAASKAPVASKAAVPVPTGCAVALLPTGGIKKALITASDPSGRYQAGRIYPGDDVRTVFWKDGVLQSTPSMPGADASYDDINSAGLAVGTSFEGEEQRAYATDRGTVKQLAGGRAAAAAVNDKGVIVGTLGAPFFDGVPARWASATARPEKLPLPDGYIGGDATVIDEDGTVAGRIYRKVGRLAGYLWRPDGTVSLLPVPPGNDFFWPESISDGWVYGRAGQDTGVKNGRAGSAREFTSFKYDIAANKYERMPVNMGPPALGAENGRVLGVTEGYSPVIVAGSKIVDLPRYRNLKEYEVTGFSADGKVAVGYTTDTDRTEGVVNRPLRWTCH